MGFIEAENLRKQFDPPRGVAAVDGVSFSIEKVRFTVSSANGAGKPTISILSCL